MKKYSCIALTRQGAELAAELARNLPEHTDVFLPRAPNNAESRFFPSLTDGRAHAFTSLPDLLLDIFDKYDGHIFISAAGIAVRAVAPLLKGKQKDPAVVVCDQRGRFCVSLLSGHWGGANNLARRIAALTSGQAVITTATDVESLPAVDVMAREANCRILDWPEIKTINAAILRGETVPAVDPLHILRLTPPLIYVSEQPPQPRPAVYVHWRAVKPRPNLARLAPPVLHAGIGCRLGVSAKDIMDALRHSLAAINAEPASLAALASIDAKKSEAGLLEAAADLGLPLKFFSAARLAAMPVRNPSAKASQIFNRPGLSVCEGAALASALNVSEYSTPASDTCICETTSPGPSFIISEEPAAGSREKPAPALVELLLEKAKYKNVTVALAASVTCG